MTPLIVENLNKKLASAAGEVHALKNFSASFEAGKRYAVIGPSGCGKSTLLYLLGLLDKPSSGEITLCGERTSKASEATLESLRNRHIGFVFQFHYLLPELTVLENLLLPALKAGTEKTVASERARELLKSIGLSAKEGRKATEISGGEQQRVAVARALMNRPKIILADEPTGNLDSSNTETVFSLLEKSSVGAASTLIMVTHNPDLAARCEVQIRLKDGLRVQ